MSGFSRARPRRPFFAVYVHTRLPAPPAGSRGAATNSYGKALQHRVKSSVPAPTNQRRVAPVFVLRCPSLISREGRCDVTRAFVLRRCSDIAKSTSTSQRPQETRNRKRRKLHERELPASNIPNNAIHAAIGCPPPLSSSSPFSRSRPFSVGAGTVLTPLGLALPPCVRRGLTLLLLLLLPLPLPAAPHIPLAMLLLRLLRCRR